MADQAQVKPKKQVVQVQRTAIFTGRYCHRTCGGLNAFRLGWWCGYWRKNLNLDPESGDVHRCGRCEKEAKVKEDPHG
jgi:hypothetical protein